MSSPLSYDWSKVLTEEEERTAREKFEKAVERYKND